jgi:hypothetical protein
LQALVRPVFQSRNTAAASLGAFETGNKKGRTLLGHNTTGSDNTANGFEALELNIYSGRQWGNRSNLDALAFIPQ